MTSVLKILREREISYDVLYTWNVKRHGINELIDRRLTDLENELKVARGKDGEKG